MHDDFARSHKAQGPTERSFGLTVGAVVAVIGCVRLYLGHSYALWVLGVGVALIVLGAVWPAGLAPLNRWWMRLGLVLNRIVSPVIMTLLYCLTMVPFGLVMRLRGKDPLRLKFDPGASSYWIERAPPGPEPESMRNQF